MKINNKGFTFVEILAVIVIIGLLSGISIAAFSKYKENAIKSDYEALARSSYSAMEEYMMSHPYDDKVSLEVLEEENLLSNRKDPGSKEEDCTGTVEVSKKEGSNSKIDDGEYKVYLCCVSIQKIYTYPGGKETNLTDRSKCNYVPEEPIVPPTPTTKYTLKYNDNNGSGCSTKTITRNKNEAWGTLCTPKRTGYTFNGWYDGSTKVTNTTKATKSVTVKASWTANTTKYTLKYNDNNGSGCSTKTITRNKNEAWGTLCTPKRTGYTFNGWYDGSTKVTSSTKATKSVTVKASWTMPRPNKPIIKNPTNGKWTINDVTLTISTTSNNNIIGKWYYKYGSGSYKALDKTGVNSFNVKHKNEYIGIYYIKVCNKVASGYNDTKNCSEVASTQLKIEKTKPKVKFTKTGSLGESRVPDENKEKGYVVEDVYLDGYTVELSVSNSPPSGIKSRKMTCTGSKYFGYGTYKSSGFTTSYNTDTKKIFIPNLDPEKEEETYVIKITCAAEVKTNAGNVNSKTVAEGLIGNGWLTKDGIWNFKAYGKEVIGWKKIYWFTTDPDPNRDSIASKGSWDWYYFYNGNETYEKNHCHGSKGHMADGWCKCLPKIDGTGEYKKWFYFQRKVADEYLQPNDTTGKKWFYWGSMYLNGTNMSIGGEKYKFNSYGYCVEGRDCSYGDLSC